MIIPKTSLQSPETSYNYFVLCFTGRPAFLRFASLTPPPLVHKLEIQLLVALVLGGG